MVGLTFGVPARGMVRVEWAFNLHQLVPPMNYATRFILLTQADKGVDWKRNQVCEFALQNKSRYMFFIDEDVFVPAHTLKQLIMRMENDPDLAVVGGVYCSKSEPSAPLVFRNNGVGSYWNWKAGEYFEVTGLGMGCTLIRTEWLKKISKPYFLTYREIYSEDNANLGEEGTEDLYFLRKISDAGGKIMCDSSILCEHWDYNSGKIYRLPPGTIPVSHLLSKGKVVDYGSGETHVTFPEGPALRVDAREDVHPDFRCDLRKVPFESEQFEVVFSSHTLEHFSREESVEVLTEWVRTLKKGGKLRIIVPNIRWAADRLSKEGIYDQDVFNVFYGQQSYGLNFHKNGFTPETATDLVEKVGCKVDKMTLEGYNICIEATKLKKWTLKQISTDIPVGNFNKRLAEKAIGNRPIKTYSESESDLRKASVVLRSSKRKN